MDDPPDLSTAADTETVRVFLLDDHEIVRRGIAEGRRRVAADL